MAAGRLSVDTHVLVDTGQALRGIATEFERADDRSDEAASFVGNPGLAERVREFTRNWDDRRAEMLESIATLGEYAAQTGEAFEQIDTEFGAALQGDA